MFSETLVRITLCKRGIGFLLVIIVVVLLTMVVARREGFYHKCAAWKHDELEHDVLGILYAAPFWEGIPWDS